MLFQDLSPCDAGVLIRAVSRVWDRADELGMIARGGRWSLCELSPDEDDFAWLLKWAAHWNAIEARDWLQLQRGPNAPGETWVRVGNRSLQKHSVAGVLLLLFCSECARRDSKGDEIWPSVRGDSSGRNRFSLAHDVLWGENGAPRGRFYRALADGAARLGVRRLFVDEGETPDAQGSEERQEYTGTIRLQFGFSHKGAQEIARWLCGYSTPKVISDLREEGANRSPEFRALWSELIQFRDQFKNQSQAEQESEIARRIPKWSESFWLLHGKETEVARAALKQPELKALRAPHIVDEAILAIHETTNHTPSLFFLGAPCPKVRGREIEFWCEALSLAANSNFGSPQNSPVLHMAINGNILGQWHWNAQSKRYQPTQKQFCISQVFSSPKAVARLLGAQGQPLARQEISFWNAEDGLGWWEIASGKPLDVWSGVPKPERQYALLVDADLTVTTKPSVWGTWKGYQLLLPDANWWKNARIEDDGALFWTPLLCDEPQWASGLEISLTASQPLTLGQTFGVKVQCPPLVQVQSLEWNGRILESVTPDEFQVGPLTTENFAPSLKIKASLTHQDGNSTSVARRLRVPLQAILWRENSDSPWQSEHLRVCNSSHPRQWRFLGQWDESARVCEGDVPFDHLPRRARALKKPPHRLGAPLTVRTAPYGPKDIVKKVCGHTRDSGILLDAKLLNSQSVVLQFHTAIEPDKRHQVIVWAQGEDLADVPPEYIRASEREWHVEFHLENPHAKIWGVALAYGGQWLGAHFRQDWFRLLEGPWSSERARRFANLMRWMRLPWLENKAAICRLAHDWPLEFLVAWLGKGLNDWGLEPSHKDEEDKRRHDLVRQIFGQKISLENQRPTDLAAAWNHAGEGNLESLYAALFQASPWLARDFAFQLQAQNNSRNPLNESLIRRVMSRIQTDSECSPLRGQEHLALIHAIRARFHEAQTHEQTQILDLQLSERKTRASAALTLLEIWGKSLNPRFSWSA